MSPLETHIDLDDRLEPAVTANRMPSGQYASLAHSGKSAFKRGSRLLEKASFALWPASRRSSIPRGMSALRVCAARVYPLKTCSS